MVEEVVLACPELGDAQSEPLKEIELVKKAKHFYHLCFGKKQTSKKPGAAFTIGLIEPLQGVT